MSPANDLLLLMFNLTQLHSSDKIIELFVGGLQEIFRPVICKYHKSINKSRDHQFPIATQRSKYGSVTVKFEGEYDQTNLMLISNACQMLGIILEHLLFDQEIMRERDRFDTLAREKVKELEHIVKDLSETRSASINLIEDLTREVEMREEREREISFLSARNEAILGSVPNIIMEVDANRVYTWANSEGLNFFGDDVIGKSADQYFEGNQETLSVVKPLFEGKSGSIYVESWQRRRDGEKRLLAWWCNNIRDKDGEVKSVLSSATDITEQKSFHEILRRSEEKFRHIFENSALGKSMTGMDGSMMVNRAFCKMVGYSEEELTNTSWQKITHKDDIEESERVVRSLLNGEKRTASYEKRYIRKNGDIVWAEVNTTLMPGKEEVPGFFITSVNDITWRKAAADEIKKLNAELESRVIERTAQLEEANRELEAFSYSVSHDLRAPLRAIHSFTKILVQDYGEALDDEGRRICGIIESGSVHMGQLIDDLLHFSRVGRTDIHYSDIDLKVMTESVFNELIVNTADDNITCRVGNLPHVKGDTALIKQVVTNLLTNAIKYSSGKREREIEVCFEKEKDVYIFSVKDNGVGFDMQYVNKLFGVFQRLHSSREFEGNGVGLAIVKRIVERHGGSVWAEGETGRGATFYFTLPIINL